MFHSFPVLLMKGVRDLTKDPRTVKEKHDDYFRFTIPCMTTEDSGTYCVVVKNKFGTDRAFCTVRVSREGGPAEMRRRLCGFNSLTYFPLISRDKLMNDSLLFLSLCDHHLYSPHSTAR